MMKYAKALILLALIVIAALVQLFGLDLQLDAEHFLGLLLADLAVWYVPNEEDTDEPDRNPGE